MTGSGKSNFGILFLPFLIVVAICSSVTLLCQSAAVRSLTWSIGPIWPSPRPAGP